MRLCKFRDKIAKLGWKTLMPNQITYAMSTIALLKGRDWTYAMKSILSWKTSAEYIFNFFKLNKTYLTHFVLSSVYIFVISYHQPRKLYTLMGKFFSSVCPQTKGYVFPLYCLYFVSVCLCWRVDILISWKINWKGTTTSPE